MMFSTQQVSREMDAELSEGYESSVIAREMARSALNVAAGKAHRDWEEAVSYINGNLAEVAQEGGTSQTIAAGLSATSMEIAATGVYGAQSYQIKKTFVLAGPLDGAFIVDAPFAAPVFGGPTFLIDGVDRRPLSVGSSLPTTAMNKPGLKTNSILVRNQFGAALSGLLGRVRGVVNEDGDVGGGSLKADSHWEVDLDALYEEAVDHPDKQILLGLIVGTLFDVTLGSVGSPVVAHVPTSALITGTVNGYGILVVDGDLTVLGDFTWEGIVLVREDSGDLNLNYGGNARIYGSLIAMQRGDDNWAFTMPTDGRLRVTYKYSSAGFGSEVWISPWGMSNDLLFERGSNRTGDQMNAYDQVFHQGQRMNFFINVLGSLTGTSTPHLEYWNHYAAGHLASSGTPYAEVEQLGEYKWEIRFEDLPEGHPSQDWDYNDQVIEVEIIPDDGGVLEDDPWWTEGEEGEEEETEEDDDAPSMGDTFIANISGNAQVLYSAEAIARLGSKLTVIRDATRIVVVDQWEGRSDEAGEE